MTNIGAIFRQDGKEFKLIKIVFINSEKYAMYGKYEHWHRWIVSRKAWSKTPSFYVLIK